MSDPRRGTEQANICCSQADELLDGNELPAFLLNDDPVLEMALLVELYVQDLTLLSLFCQHITKYSYRILYFDPELVCKKESDPSSTSMAIRQLLNTAMDLSVDQLIEYISTLSSEITRHREKLNTECRRLKETLALHRSYEECLARERIAIRYTKDIQEIDALVREGGLCTASPTLIINPKGKLHSYVISATVLHALLFLLDQKRQPTCFDPMGKTLTADQHSHSRTTLTTTTAGYFNDQLPPKVAINMGVPVTHESDEIVSTILLVRAKESVHTTVEENHAHSFNHNYNTQSNPSRVSMNTSDNEVDDLLAQLLSDDNEHYATSGTETISSNLLSLQCDLIKSKGETSILATQKEADARKILELADEVQMLSASLDRKDERLAVLEQEFASISEHAQCLERDLEEQSAELTIKRKEAVDNAIRADEKTNELALVSKELGLKLNLLKKAAAEISRLKELLAQNSDSIEFSKAKITELQNEIEIKDAEIRRNENRIERLQNELTEKTEALHAFKLMDTKMRHDLEEAKDGMERASSKTIELENMLAQKSLQLDRKITDITVLMEENTKFSTQIVGLLNSTNSLKLEVEQLRLERNASYGDIKRLSAELSQKETDLCDALKKLEMESEKLSQTEELLSEKKIQLEKLTMDLTVKNSDIAKLTADSIAKAEELNCKSETIQHLHGEISTLHDKLLDDSSSAARIAEVKELLRAKSDLKTRICNLESLNTELQQDSERYKLEINRLSLALEERDRPSTALMNTAGSKLRQVSTETPVEMSSGSHILNISSSLDEKMDHMHTSWRRLQEVLDETEKEKQELMVRLQDAQKLIETLHTQLKRPDSSDKHRIDNENYVPEGKIHVLQDELAASKAKVKSLREALSSLKVAYKSLLENMNEITAVMNEQNVREEKYKKRVEELTAELDILRTLNVPGDGVLSVEALSHEYTVVNEELKRTTTELSEVQTALQHANAREEALLERLTNAAASATTTTTMSAHTTHTVLEGNEIDIIETQEEAIQVSIISQELPPHYMKTDAETNTVIPLNYREANDVENEISGLHSTIATLTCELVQLRGECVLLKQQIQAGKH